MKRINIKKNHSLLMADQILARLAWLIGEGGIEVSETFVDDAYMYLQSWDNCREQGYQIICDKYYDKASRRAGYESQKMIFAFGEDRNVDQPVLWINRGGMVTQTWLTGSEDFRSINGEKSKYDAGIETVDECAQIIYDEMEKFYSDIEVLDNDQIEDLRHYEEPRACKLCETVMTREDFPDDELWDDGYCSPKCWEKGNIEAYIPAGI